MRFVSVSVRSFKAIEQAHVELGPHLNVLHGANDVGKSTLASAIRAVLLLPDNSSAHREFVPWNEAAAPFVELVLEADDRRFYRVRKQFASDSQRSSTLEWSNDGVTFANDCSGRAVDDRLRDLLSWGVPPTGGRGGPRGLPETFLSKALLAEQTAVDEILQQSLDDDPHESGKVRLQNALSALVQNPAVKDVLDAAQREVDTYFTATGRKRSSATSPFKHAADRVRQAEREVLDLTEKLKDSEVIESEVREREKELQGAQAAVEDRVAQVKALDVSLQETRALELADREVERAAEGLARIDTADAAVVEAEKALESLSARADTAEKEEREARRLVEEAQETVRLRENELTRAQSQEAGQAIALRQGELERERLELDQRQSEARALLGRAEAAIDAEAKAKATAERLADARRQLDSATARRATARAELDATQQSLDTAQELRRFLAYREAEAQLEGARGAAAALEKDEVKLQDLELQASQKGAAIESLPALDAETVQRVVDADRVLETAKAAVSAGLLIEIDRHHAVPVRVEADEQPAATSGASTDPVTFSAEREADVHVGDQVSLHIRAGSEDARASVDAARKRWRIEAQPVLDRAGVSNLSLLQERLAELERARNELLQLEQACARLREQVERGREGLPDVSVLEARVATRRDELDTADIEELSKAVERLGDDAERTVAGAIRQAEAKRPELSRELDQAERDCTRLESDLEHLNQAVGEAEGDRDAKLRELDADPVVLKEQLARDMGSRDTRRAEIDETMASLAAEVDDSVRRARSALDAAGEVLARARKKHQEAAAQRLQAEREQAAAEANLRGRREHADSLDRQSAEADHAQAVARRRELPEPESRVDEEQLERARAALDEARGKVETAGRELAEKKGALEHVGGNVVQERLDEARRALEVAKAEEKELELRADAWLLVRDAVKEAQSQVSSHIGRGLAAHVETRFQDLTQGRYARVDVEPALITRAVHFEGGPREPRSLSVGTREQLATLLRLAIAEALAAPILLDDHLVQSDSSRLQWFRSTLLSTASTTQVVVLTCRPEDYQIDAQHPVSYVDLSQHLHRWPEERD